MTENPETSSRPLPFQRIRNDLYWLVPTCVAVVALVSFLLLNQSWGANVAGILTLPLEVLGIAISILIARGVLVRRQAVPSRRRRSMAIVISGVTVLVSIVFYLVEREKDPFDFLSGDVRIGYVDPGYPGWNEGTSPNRYGFDAAIGRAILDYFPDMKSIQWVPLNSLDDRIKALNGPWGKGEIKPVKLVISNFSITELRRRDIDFAGPYFNDAEGFATHNQAATSMHDIKIACVPAGSTAEERLRKLGIKPVVELTVQACFQRFFQQDEGDMAVSTDLSIVQAYVSAQRATGKKFKAPKFVSVATEQYGIGLPNNSPKLCAKVNEALDRYMDLGWQTDFDDTLGRLGISSSTAGSPRIDRNPKHSDPCESAAPWRK